MQAFDAKFLLVLICAVSSALGISLRCRFGITFHPASMRRVYQCKADPLQVGDPTQITAYSGVHQFGLSSSDVEILSIRNCEHLRVIPLGAFNFFPNLTGLHFVACGILQLSGDDLREYPHLTWFGLESSALESIPGNFFQHTPNMSGVSFGGNDLLTVGENLLSILPRLHRAYFLYTPCISMAAMNEQEIPALIDALRVNCPEN